MKRQSAEEKRQEIVGDMLFLANKLPYHERSRLLKVFNVGDGLSDQERRYVEEYCVDCDRENTAMRLSMDPTAALEIFRRAAVQDAIRQKLLEQGQYSTLRAEYLRDYMYHLLEFSPTDYFELGSDGSWVITPEKFNEVPAKIRRYVQSVETRRVGGEVYCTVKFMNKEAAMRLAAKYTLVEKVDHSHTVAFVPWDSLVHEAEEKDERAVEMERRIEALVESVHSRSPEVPEGVLAGRDLLPGATPHP